MVNLKAASILEDQIQLVYDRESSPAFSPEVITTCVGEKPEMAPNEMLSEAYARIRRQAEDRIKQWSHDEANEHTDLHELIHELKIHLAEQEIINEELRQTMILMKDGEKTP